MAKAVRSRHSTILVSGLLAALSLLSGCAQMPWEELSPRYRKDTFPQAYKFKSASPQLESIWTSDGIRLWAVGENGTILASEDGKHWKLQASGTHHYLRSIAGTSNGNRLWVVGEKGTILESDDGEHWRPRDSGTQNDLRSIFAAGDGRRLCAVGERGTILASEDGEHWSAQPSGTQNSLQSVLGTSDGKHLWAIGAKGTILQSDEKGRWNPRNSGTQEYLWSLFGTSDRSRLWVVGADGRISTSNDGEHWIPWTTVTLQHATSIFGTADGRRLWVVGNNGTILESEDGVHWKARSSPTENNLRSLVGTNDGKRLWAVGTGSTILESHDGEHWNPVTSVIQEELTSIFGTRDGRRLWVVGTKGTILASEDGEHWKVVTSGTQNDLWSIYATSDGSRLWAAGPKGTILTSEDGARWKIRNSGTQNNLDSIFATDDGNRVWIVGSAGTILGSNDGERWENHASSTQNDLTALYGSSDGRRLWAVGGKGTILKSEGGDVWKSYTSGTESSLLAVFVTDDGNRVWAAGENGTILESNDGEHWKARFSGTQEDLVSLFGTNDGERMWAVGRKGTILQSDDGSHWNTRSSNIQQDLLSLFGTSDGKRLWAVGPHGTILQGEAQSSVPVIRQARIVQKVSGPLLELQLQKEHSSLSPIEISVQGRNDYDEEHNFPWREVSACSVPGDNLEQWLCSFQPDALNLEVGHKVHFLIHLQRGRESDLYEFTSVYDPWQLIKKNRGWVSLAAAVFLCTILPTVLLFVRPLWNLKVYRAIGLARIDQIKIPMIGDAVQIAVKLVTILPWFVRHPRTLDAWIEQHREQIQRIWNAEPTPGNTPSMELESESPQPIYIPLPIRVDQSRSGELIEQPSAAQIRPFVKPSRTTIQIVGPGGSGKTTLARQIGEWALQSGSGSGLSGHPMLPVWVDEELDPEKKPLLTVVKGRLIAALIDEKLEDELYFALLKRQRLMVLVDRLSERSVATQEHIKTLYRSASIGCVVLTSRIPFAMDGARSIIFYPQTLNSATLLNFMTGLLSVLLANTDSEGQLASGSFSSIQDQLELGRRLAALIRLQTEKGEEDVALVPLPVRLFVEQAVGLLAAGKKLDDLPLSLPEVYFRHLRRVNPDDPSAPHFLDGERMLRVSKQLGKLALAPNFIPKEFSKNQAVATLVAAGEVVTSSADPLIRLRMNGVLLERPGGLDIKFRFALDPVAEFLAAAAHAEECAGNAAEWEKVLSAGNGAPGFQVALKLVRQTYGESKGWATPHVSRQD